jgi:ketosteroid isomerase-like protein
VKRDRAARPSGDVAFDLVHNNIHGNPLGGRPAAVDIKMTRCYAAMAGG